MIEELGADYHPSTMQVTDLQSAAKLVLTVGELIRPGNEYIAIREYLHSIQKMNPKIDNMIRNSVWN